MDFKQLFNNILKKNFKELTTKELSLLVRHKTLSIELEQNEEAIMEKLENEFTQANELRKNSVANTSGTAGAAAEFVPENVTVSTLIDLNNVGESFGFLSRLMGKQTLSAKKVTVPVIGRPGKAKILAESASAAQFRAAKEGLQSANTGKIEIEAKKVYNNIQITDELRKYSVIELDALFVGRLKDGILLAMADAIINADSSDTTSNINYKGTKPSEGAVGYADEARYQYNNGLRKSALTGTTGVTKIDVGTIEGVNDIFKLQALVTSTSNPAKKLVIIDQKTYYAFLEQDDFKDAAKNGAKSTIFSGAITNIGGSDIFVTDLISLAGTDGYVSATAANNVTGSILVFDITAIQHGDYEDLKFNVESDFAIGELFEAYGYWGFANMQNKDGLVFVAIGYDVTLSA